MAAWKIPTYSDDTPEAPNTQPLAPRTASQWKIPTYEDKPEEKKVSPADGGSTLQVLNPFGENFDTGINIGEGTTQFLAGAGKRFADIGRRAKQIAGVKGAQEAIDEAAKLDQALMEKTPAMFGYAMPDILVSMALPFAMSARGVAALNTIRGAMLQGGAQGALLEPVTSDEKHGTLNNIGVGMLGGGLGQLVGQGISKLGAKAIHAAPAMIPDKLRQIATSKGIALPQPTWSSGEERRLYDLARAKGVPTTIGDIDPTSAWANVEDANRVFWSGRSGDMQKQQDATRKVLTELRDSISSGSPGSDGAMIVKGVSDKLAEAKRIAGDKFKAVEGIAGRSPNLTPVKPNNTYLAAKAAEADYPAIFDEFKSQPVIRKLLGLAEDTGPQPGMIINPKDMKPFKYDQELNFSDAQWLRKRLGAWYDKLHGQLESNSLPAGVDGEAVKHAAAIFSAFNKDLDQWGNQPGNKALNDAWKDARGYFKDNVLPFRDPQKLASKSKLIRDMTTDNVDTATVVDKALPRRETSISGDIMAHSTPEGQRAMRSALVHKIVDPAINPDIQGLNNASLIHRAADQEHAVNSVFTPRQVQALDDAADIAKLTRRSSEAGTTTPRTGARLLPFMAGSTIAGTAPAAYFGLGMAGDSLDPSTRAALAIGAAPLAVLGIMKGSNNYARSALGKNLHFADPVLKGKLGGLQQLIERGVRGAGEPLLDEYTTMSLGHRE